MRTNKLSKSTLWKVTCEEEEYPGLWQLWFKNQCVAIGWPPGLGYKLHNKTKKSSGWFRARKAVKEMDIGHTIVVALRGNTLARMGTITGKAIEDDEWKPLVDPSPTCLYGEKGRRIFVRWDLTIGPSDTDSVVKLPTDCRLTNSEFRPTVSKINSHSIEKLKSVMNNSKNWVGLLGKFRLEKALSDYISSYPHHLEDGLSQYPNSPRIREIACKGATRLDVLLIDRNKRPVVIECKQDSPTKKDITQLRGYMKNLKSYFKKINHKSDKRIRGILVHGGSQNISKEVISFAKKDPKIEIVSYRMKVDFTRSL